MHSVFSETDEHECSNILLLFCTYHGSSEIKCLVSGAKRHYSIVFKNKILHTLP